MKIQGLTVTASVREVVHFVLRGGDLTGSKFSWNHAQAGSAAHRHLQAIPERYHQTEVALSWTGSYEEMTFTIKGRADGVKEDPWLVDEIKSTWQKMSAPLPEHLAQAKMYAWMLCQEKGADQIEVSLTYVHLKDHQIESFASMYSAADLSLWAQEVIGEYLRLVRLLVRNRVERDRSLEALPFSFTSYRSGQKKLINDVYRALLYEKPLFVQAPTGIGKTAAVLYAALKSFSYLPNDKIFYLTARNTHSLAVSNALLGFIAHGLRCTAVLLCARDKLCAHTDCPQCPYASEHGARISPAVLAVLEKGGVLGPKELVLESQAHRVCPAVLAQEIAQYADVVVGDYNYAFDPQAALPMLEEPVEGRYIFLVDEAHHLPGRLQEMYSARISLSDLYPLQKALKDFRRSARLAVSDRLYRVLNALSRTIAACQPQLPTQAVADQIAKAIEPFLEKASLALGDLEIAESSWLPELLELYFKTLHLKKILDQLGDDYQVLYEGKKSDTQIEFFCLDPSRIASKLFKRSRGLVAFSATLSPPKFFMRLLGKEDAVYLDLPSPFPKENLLVLLDTSLDLRYNRRMSSQQQLCDRIEAAVGVHTGNYLVFFPGYEYLRQILDCYGQLFPQRKIIAQRPAMTLPEQQALLESFVPDPLNSHVVFAVAGGMFSEGIDLMGERLSGAIICSLSLPQINEKSRALRNYFDRLGTDGFHYAYTFPGLQKVVQSAGRVIRSAKDRGFILLIDARFRKDPYPWLLPKAWQGLQITRGPAQIQAAIADFYDQEDSR